MTGFFAFYAWHGWRPFDSLDPYASQLDQARALTFLGIVSGQVGCLFAQRDGSLTRRLSLTSNAWICWGLMFELALALMVVYIPGINGLFAMEGPPVAWLAVLPLGAAAFLLIDQCRRLLVERPDRRS